ncbi:VOC family protein [Rivibacter subsaxonicus]|uniref:VOC domain-containing protein n=1 Tax=Rivibacter subsaxonicus TaxID=457575 RepID=A0A4Q7VW59_9BURK|nr:VOC family protein [Rivibacter subsaxonicus]RZU00944.1 hypothetical protein EV670_1657 [Rivibacter subsaxonicus]
MSSVFAIDHVQLPIPPGGGWRAREFYEERLGLRELRDPALDRPGTLRFQLGVQRLDLHEGPYSGVAPQAHLALRVRGLRDFIGALRERGLRVDTGGVPDVGARAYLDDPFGNRIELIDALVLGAAETAYEADPLEFAV